MLINQEFFPIFNRNLRIIDKKIVKSSFNPIYYNIKIFEHSTKFAFFYELILNLFLGFKELKFVPETFSNSILCIHNKLQALFYIVNQINNLKLPLINERISCTLLY